MRKQAQTAQSRARKLNTTLAAAVAALIATVGICAQTGAEKTGLPSSQEQQTQAGTGQQTQTLAGQAAARAGAKPKRVRGRGPDIAACAVEYALNTETGPKGWEKIAEKVLQEIAQTTGIEFTATGINKIQNATTPRFLNREPVTSINIEWDTSRTKTGNPVLLTEPLAMATWTGNGGLIENGTIALNLETLWKAPKNRQHTKNDKAAQVLANYTEDAWPPAFNKTSVPLSLLLRHEIGHLLGLGHVSDYDSVMYPQPGLFLGKDALDKDTRNLLAKRYQHCK